MGKKRVHRVLTIPQTAYRILPSSERKSPSVWHLKATQNKSPKTVCGILIDALFSDTKGRPWVQWETGLIEKISPGKICKVCLGPLEIEEQKTTKQRSLFDETI